MKRIRIVLEDVAVPGNQPIKLRITAVNKQSRPILLGSTGIEALGRGESGQRRLPALRIDVTRALREFLSQRGDARELQVEIQAVDGKNYPVPDLKSSVQNVRIEEGQH